WRREGPPSSRPTGTQFVSSRRIVLGFQWKPPEAVGSSRLILYGSIAPSVMGPVWGYLWNRRLDASAVQRRESAKREAGGQTHLRGCGAGFVSLCRIWAWSRQVDPAICLALVRQAAGHGLRRLP